MVISILNDILVQGKINPYLQNEDNLIKYLNVQRLKLDRLYFGVIKNELGKAVNRLKNNSFTNEVDAIYEHLISETSSI